MLAIDAFHLMQDKRVARQQELSTVAVHFCAEHVFLNIRDHAIHGSCKIYVKDIRDTLLRQKDFQREDRLEILKHIVIYLVHEGYALALCDYGQSSIDIKWEHAPYSAQELNKSERILEIEIHPNTHIKCNYLSEI
jgi:hypothetical protein